MKRSGMKRSQPRRQWKDARAKVEVEGQCRSCGCYPLNIQAAHILGRSHDKSSGYVVEPNRIVPLCGSVYGQDGCHERYDRHELDIWNKLTLEEQGQAIEDAGSFWLAVKRAAPLEYRRVLQQRNAA